MKLLQAGGTGVAVTAAWITAFIHSIKSALSGRGLLLVLVMAPSHSGDIPPSHHQWQRGKVLGKPSSNPLYSEECFLNNEHF